LAAEAFRYSVTQSPEALANVWQILRGIHSLLDITGTDLLARCLVPTNSPYASAIQQAEAGTESITTRLGGTNYFWIGNTSRDQYSARHVRLECRLRLIDDPR
jgi:hypothetical protein